MNATMNSNVRTVYTVTCDTTAKVASIESQRADWAREREAFEDSRRFKGLDIAMRTNRCAWM